MPSLHDHQALIQALVQQLLGTQGVLNACACTHWEWPRSLFMLCLQAHKCDVSREYVSRNNMALQAVRTSAEHQPCTTRSGVYTAGRHLVLQQRECPILCQRVATSTIPVR